MKKFVLHANTTQRFAATLEVAVHDGRAHNRLAA